MKLKLLAALIFQTFVAYSQEMESDLYATLSNNTLAIFMKSIYSSMDVSTFRASNEFGLVEEHTTTYKKGKINPERINFTTAYTEFFVLEDRKKSLGKFEINSDNQIFRYERTDFNRRNIRTFTYYHYYVYDNWVVQREQIRSKEYLGTGSVEVDTLVTKDSILYTINKSENTISQKDLSEGGSTTVYTLEGNKLIKKSNALTGFSKEEIYSYDAKGQLASIEIILTGGEGQSISNLTKIHYSIEGLVTEVLFQDQSGEVLEKKVFTYK
ncbi:MAG: hypothetical protein IPO32_04160 [Crocinitomicaceae bacterium]|nr:hypothetical protein [Crocinitomicaceae bacterium]